MSLAEALGLAPGEIVALVGGGGKTTAMLRLASELAARGGRVVVTCTTRIYRPEHLEPGAVVLSRDLDDLVLAARAALERCPIVVVAREEGADRKLAGVDPGWVRELRERLAATVLVEADGSGGRPLKVPASHEPVIPPSADLVIAVAGLSVLGRPIAAENVHRPERLAVLAGVQWGDPVTPRVVAAVLLHPEGASRGVPPGARVVHLLNQADDRAGLEAGRRIARELIAGGARRVVISSVQHEPPVVDIVVAGDAPAMERSRGRVGAIVLAAGLARRMGRQKLALRIGGKSILRRVVECALAARVDEVVVVLGHGADVLEGDLPRDARLRTVLNPRFSEGQSTSVRAGLAALGSHVDAAVFLLGDQPTVLPETIDALVDAFRAGGTRLARPSYRGTPGHPVLFARALFPELAAVSGDRGGRDVLARHRAETLLVPVDRDVPADVDTEDDYRGLAGDSQGW